MPSLAEQLATWQSLSTGGSPTEKWQSLRSLALSSIYVFAKGVCGFADMTPDFHGVLCRDLDRLSLPFGRRLDLWPRGHLKTHILTIAKSIQDYLKDHNTRILLAAAGKDGAMKNLRKIKSIFETNTTLQWLFPEAMPDTKGDRWTAMEITLPRTKNHPEPTFKTIGVGGHITGFHFDVIRKDDLIDEKTEKSPEIMEKIIDWHLLTKNLLESPTSGVDHLIGTRWSMADLYQWIIDREPEYTVTTVQAIHPATGRPVWPERFTMEALIGLKAKDPYNFACQQMNNPRDENIVTFRAEWLQYYALDKVAGDLLCHAH